MVYNGVSIEYRNTFFRKNCIFCTRAIVEKPAQSPLRSCGGSGVEQGTFTVISLKLVRKGQTKRGEVGVGTWLVIDDLVVRFDSDGEVGKTVKLTVALNRKP